jgi:tetratricopeptide (TPR) repeat protein
LRTKGDLDAAELLYRRALQARERKLGPEHPDTLVSVNNLAAFLYAKGDYDGAAPLFRQSLEARERKLGPEHPDTLIGVSWLGYVLQAKGDLAAAEPLLIRAAHGNEKKLGPEHPYTTLSVCNLGWLQTEKRERTAIESFERCARSWTDPTDWHHHWARLGLTLYDALETGDFGPAEQVLSDLIALVGSDHDRVGKARDKIALVRKLRGSG